MMRAWAYAAALIAGVAYGQAVPSAAPEQPIPAGPDLAQMPPAEVEARSRQLLFGTQAQNDANFLHMEALLPGHVVRARGPVRALPTGRPLAIDRALVDAYMRDWNTAGVIVLKEGKVVLERYARGLNRQQRWTSFSVAKSFTSTLVGAAIKDGYIRSVDEPVTKYIPELAGSGYDGVTIAQLLTMTSGVKWSENYADPDSDVARIGSFPLKPGDDPVVVQMRTLPRAQPPGTKWAYKTGETNLIGVLVRRATGRVLANYLSERVFTPAGMEHDGFWLTDKTDREIAGCCLSLRLRDYARMGQFVLEGGRGAVPSGWFAEATRAHASIGRPDFGYGYQWWTYPGGLFGGEGIFGQMVTVDRQRKVVIVILSAWPKASARAQDAAWYAFVQQLLTASDRDARQMRSS